MFKYIYMFLYNSVILLNLCIVRSLMLPSILAMRREEYEIQFPI